MGNGSTSFKSIQFVFERGQRYRSFFENGIVRSQPPGINFVLLNVRSLIGRFRQDSFKF